MSIRTCAALAAVSAAALLAGSGEAQASGFALREQSGSMLGQAFAGQNAYAMDPSIIFFNPAGMSALDGTQASAVASFIFPSNEFENDGSTTVFGPAVLGTNEGGDAGENALVPTAYGMTSFGDFRVGVGVNAPFGLTTEYDENWIGRYAAVTSSLRTINVNPVVSYQVTPWLAIGAGAQIQRVDARLTNRLFFGMAGEGMAELQADDVGYGFTAGALITPGPGTMIGIGFRSSVSHELEGQANFEIPPIIDAPRRRDATADLETPESLGLSVYHQLTDRLGVAGTIEWTNWSRFDELRVKFESGPDSVVEENWQDTFFVALGTNYQVSESFTARAGVAFDKSPVEDEFRTARLPDEDRFWVSLGGTWEMSDMVSIDFGFTHIFVQDAEINETLRSGGGMPIGTLSGEYENSVDIFAVQANIRL